MRPTRPILILAVAFAALAPAAAGQSGGSEPDTAPEWRIGLVAHNIHPFGYGEFQSREDGVNLEGELVGAPLRFLHAVWTPRPYAMVSANLGGHTSFAAAGFYWRIRLTKKWRLEPGLGVAVHDGELRNPYPASDPRAAGFQRDHQVLGTRLLFRDSLALERTIGVGRSVGLVLEHLSNGGDLFGNHDNESLNELGVRFSTTF